MKQKLSTQVNRIFEADGIRCLATLFILTFHYNVLLNELGISKSIGFLTYANGTMGHFGVSLFIILSGYSLTLRWDGRFQWKPYIKSRILSIFPMYWIGFGTLFLYTDIIHKALNPDIPLTHLFFTVIGMDGYLANVIPTFYKIGEWFIGCILLLYLCFPLLLRFLNKNPILTVSVTLVLFVPWVLWGVPIVSIEHSFITRIPEFLLGMLVAHYKNVMPIDRWGWALLFPLLVLFLIPLHLSEPFSALLLGICLFPILFWLFHYIRNPLLRKAEMSLGKLSYASFLVHHVVLEIIFRPCLINNPDLPVFFVYIIYIMSVLCFGFGLRFITEKVVLCTKQLSHK